MRRIALVTLSLLSIGFSAHAAETVTFHFAPPDGTNFVQTLVTVREKDLGGAQKQVDRSEATSAISIVESGDGYRIAVAPLSNRMTRDGQVMQDPVTALLHGLTITYDIDRDGQVREIRGYDTLQKKMETTLPPEIAQALAPLLNEESMVAREIAEWKGRFGDFAGKEFTIGEAVDSEATYRLPSGESLRYFVRTTVTGLQPCAAGTCAHIETSYNSDASALGRAVVDATRDLAATLKGGDSAAPQPASSKVSGSASRVVDPKTMLMYEEKLARTISISMEVPGKGSVPATLGETREYTFSYH